MIFILGGIALMLLSGLVVLGSSQILAGIGFVVGIFLIKIGRDKMKFNDNK